MKKDWKEFNDYKAYAKLYVRYRRGDPFLTLKEKYEIEKRGGTPPIPVEIPAHMLIVDDAQGTDLYTTCWKDLMSHCTIKHRHIPISICFLMQSWMGLPRVIRLNGTHFLLYKTNDRRQLEQIYSGFGNHVTWIISSVCTRQLHLNLTGSCTLIPMLRVRSLDPGMGSTTTS